MKREPPTVQAPPALAWRTLPAGALANDRSLREAWDRLNAAGLDSPFMSASAVSAALEIFGLGRERLLVGSGPAGAVSALFVLVPQGRGQWASFQPSQLPLGAWVADPAWPVQALARSLVRSGALGLALSVSVLQIDPLQAPREADAADTETADYIVTAWVDIAGDFDGYWAARGKNLRQNMRKQRNKLAADGTVPQMRWFTAPADMAPALARYGALESQGWKSGGGTAIHASNAQGRFYERLLGTAAQAGEALVTEYLFDERPVAMNFGLLRNGTWVVLKTTYDETVPKALSPASLLREDELQRIFAPDSGIRRIEYYGRMMEWHTRLTETHRTLYHLSCYRWAWLKRLAQRRRAARAAEAPAATPAPAPAEA